MYAAPPEYIKNALSSRLPTMVTRAGHVQGTYSQPEDAQITQPDDVVNVKMAEQREGT
jgi:hypothetical protein